MQMKPLSGLLLVATLVVALLPAAALTRAKATATAPASSTSITYAECQDRALCLSGCTSSQVAAGVCLSNNVNESQVLWCDPQQRVCGILSSFSDSACTQLLSTQGFVCGQCMANHDSEERRPGRMLCSAEGESNTYLNIQRCDDDRCGQCHTIANATRGACIAIRNQQGVITSFAKYEGAALCTAVRRVAWPNVQCSGEPSDDALLPVDECIRGARLHCNYSP